MRIRLQAVPDDGCRVEGEDPVDSIDWSGLDGRIVAPFSYRLFLQKVSNELIVKGEWSTQVEQECRRCGVFFSTSVADSSFLRAYEIVEDQTVEIDTAEDFREAVLLKLPSHPLCSDTCKGLCPFCGADLNRTECECTPPEFSGTWGQLDKLNLNTAPADEGRAANTGEEHGCSKKKNFEE